jgi:hypothetical protein
MVNFKDDLVEWYVQMGMSCHLEGVRTSVNLSPHRVSALHVS